MNYPILIVEDDPDGQEVVARMLREANVEVEIAASAEDALDFLKNQSYIGIIIDLALPGLDGFQLVSAIREDAKHNQTPCIAVTAFHTPELRHEALGSGFDAYFPKPLNRTLFLGAVDDLIFS